MKMLRDMCQDFLSHVRCRKLCVLFSPCVLFWTQICRIASTSPMILLFDSWGLQGFEIKIVHPHPRLGYKILCPNPWDLQRI